MIYPPNFEEKIEFDAIRQIVRNHCISAMGAEHVDMIRMENLLTSISKHLDETMEFAAILDHGSGFPAYDYFDMREELSRIRIEGTYISPEKMFDLNSSLTAITDIIKFVKNYNESKIPHLQDIISAIYIDSSIHLLATG